jgi:sugar lactone lactonase YvrE
MTNDNADETPLGARSPVGPSRRGFLGSIAVTGILASAPTTVVGRRDDASEGASELEIVADFEPPSLPENLAIDDEGTVYLSMGPSGEIRAVDSEGGESTVPTIETGDEGLLLGVTLLDGALFAANASGESETHGIWRVEPASGRAERIVDLPADESMPNGIIPAPFASDELLVSDHLGGAIWRVTTDGAADQWVADESLEPLPDAQTPVGADGLAVHPDGSVYTDNLNRGSIVRIPVEDESAGRPTVVVQDEALVGADGMTVDEDGGLYVAVNARNQVVRLTPERELETVVAGGSLDFPADVQFGATAETATSLYIANFAYGTFLQNESAATPSLARVDADVRGYAPEPGDEEPAQTDDGETAGETTETDDTDERLRNESASGRS